MRVCQAGSIGVEPRQSDPGAANRMQSIKKGIWHSVESHASPTSLLEWKKVHCTYMHVACTTKQVSINTTERVAHVCTYLAARNKQFINKKVNHVQSIHKEKSEPHCLLCPLCPASISSLKLIKTRTCKSRHILTWLPASTQGAQKPQLDWESLKE